MRLRRTKGPSVGVLGAASGCYAENKALGSLAWEASSWVVEASSSAAAALFLVI